MNQVQMSDSTLNIEHCACPSYFFTFFLCNMYSVFKHSSAIQSNPHQFSSIFVPHIQNSKVHTCASIYIKLKMAHVIKLKGHTGHSRLKEKEQKKERGEEGNAGKWQFLLEHETSALYTLNSMPFHKVDAPFHHHHPCAWCIWICICIFFILILQSSIYHLPSLNIESIQHIQYTHYTLCAISNKASSHRPRSYLYFIRGKCITT